jgi:hypothetical protein
MAITRQELHRLLDRIPDSELERVGLLLHQEALRKPTLREILDQAPFDDEPLTEEDIAAGKEALAEYAAGRTIPVSQLAPRRRTPPGR